MELDRIYHGDCRNMDKIDDSSVHLTVGSPPYAVNKGYESYIKSLEEHYQLLFDAYKEVVRVTVPGGKICVNVGDIAVGSQYNDGFPEEIMVIPKLVDYLRTLGTYLYARGVWEKDDPWQNSSHVSFHDKIQHAEYRWLPAWEYVFVFRKGRSARKDKSPEDGRWITKDEWKKLVHAVWNIRSVQKNDFHAAMFPEQLVSNCIKLYSFPNDVVLDNWMGSGTTAIVAKKMGRHFLGYELDPVYAELANNRVNSVTEEMVVQSKLYMDSTANKRSQTSLKQETIF
jgi:site-specific DNA-methyltransferase (adenine-specific)